MKHSDIVKNNWKNVSENKEIKVIAKLLSQHYTMFKNKKLILSSVCLHNSLELSPNGKWEREAENNQHFFQHKEEQLFISMFPLPRF